MKKLSFALLAGALTLSAAAQTVKKDTVTLKEVEVNGTPKAPIELLPLSYSIITGDQLYKSTETSILPVLSNHVPGMFVMERGISGYGLSSGSAGQVTMRGVGGRSTINNGVLFMIDGQPQWASIFGHAIPDAYTSAEVEKVEVVRGPSSLLYGSYAIGGSVNIITKHAKEEGFNGSARLMWGSFGTQKYSANFGYNNGKLNTFINATYERSNGARANSQYWLASQFASVQYKFSDHWKSGANVTLTEAKPHNPGTVMDPLLDMWTKEFRGTAALFVNNTYDVTSGQIQFYLNWGHHDINDGYSAHGTATNNGVPRNYLFHSNDYNFGINLYQNIKPWTDNVTSIGVDYQHWGGHAWNTMNDGSPNVEIVDKHIDDIAAYLMMQQDLANDILSLNAGLRVQHSSQYGNMLVPQAGFIVRPFKGNNIKFSWSKGFRAPNLRELYMYPPQNPDLKPEYLWNYEAEIRQLWLGGKLNTGLALFFINGRNMIQTITTPNPLTGAQKMNVNTGRYRNKGFEVDATYAICPQVDVTVNYSYLWTTGNVLYAPKNRIYAEVNYHPGHWSFTLSSNTVWDLRTGAPEPENYSLLNGRVAYNLTAIKNFPINIFCKVDNITATKYETVYGFPMPRATVLAGFDVKF